MTERFSEVGAAEPFADDGFFITFVDGMVMDTLVSEGKLFEGTPRKPDMVEASAYVMDQPDGSKLSPYEVVSRASQMSGQHYIDEGGYPMSALRHTAYELLVRRGWYDDYYPDKPYPDDCWMLSVDSMSSSFHSEDSSLPTRP